MWVVEFDGNKITGAFGPMLTQRRCRGVIDRDMIIRNEVVIQVMERRRDEFKRFS